MKNKGEIWLQAWLSIIENEFCRNAEEASFWADQCLKDYEARFGYQETNPCKDVPLPPSLQDGFVYQNDPPGRIFPGNIA